MEKCDLHIHSKFSDGSYSVEDILKIAQNENCTVISIVDHNTCDAYKYLKNINDNLFNGKIISGCEFNTFYDHIPIELLGYDFNPEILERELQSLYKNTALELKEIEKKLFINKCKVNGIKLNLDEMSENDDKHLSYYLYKGLTYYPENIKYFSSKEDFEDQSVFYRKYMSNPNSVFFSNMEKFYPTIKEVELAIRKANGKVFIPHIFEYKNNSRKILEGLMKTINIDGIECFYSKFTDSQTEKINNFADKEHLLKSGGSDCHGGKHIKIGIGRGNLDISPDMLGNWINLAKDFNNGIKENER